MTKKSILSNLCLKGEKAGYHNVFWFYNSSFDVVGGIVQYSNGSKTYFKIDESVSLVKSFEDIKDLIV
ncbi:MAG: hypothetical protein J6J11_09990 [Treponema sp.]|nr:hypothetical protein [Treponema sp.]